MGILGVPARLAEAVPGFARRIWPFLTEAERALYEGRAAIPSARAVERAYGLLPPTRELSAAAVAGGAKRGWYADSHAALQRVFSQSGVPDDPARFTALLAALSPQTSVQSNLKNAVNTWANWVRAGRPTDKDEILRILGNSVEGDKGVDSVLDAWRNNALRALTVPDANTWLEKTASLSGPKVDSFLRNLSGIGTEVTNDAWMAKLAGVDQALFGGGKRAGVADEIGDLGVKSPGYVAANAWTRKAADDLGWLPAEVQETAWSTAKTLDELANAPAITIKGMEESGLVVPQAYRDLQPSSSVDVLQGGLLSDEAIAATPAFGDLFTREPYATPLRAAGYNLDGLVSSPRTLSSPYERLGVTPEGLLGAPQGKALNQVANRLDSVVRRSEAEAWVKGAIERQQLARTPKEKRQAAQELGRARQALRRSMRELPNMPPDPKVKGALETAGAPLAAGGAAVLGAAALAPEDADAAVTPRALNELRDAVSGIKRGDYPAPAFDALRRQLVDGVGGGGPGGRGVPVYDRGIASAGDGPVGTPWTLPGEYRDELGKLGIATPNMIELPGSEEGAKRFHAALAEARDASPYGKAVTLYPEADYQGMRLFLAEDGKAGFALKPDGDIVSVFNHPASPHRQAGAPMVLLGVQEGGRKLDAYDTVLPSIYSQVGFRESARVPFNPEFAPDGWPYGLLSKVNKGQPDVVLMHQELTKPAAPRSVGPEDYNPHRPLAPDWDAAAETQTWKMRAGMRAEEAAARAARREKLAREQTHVPHEVPPVVNAVTTGVRDMLFDPENLLGFLPPGLMGLLWPRQMDGGEQLPPGELRRQLGAAGLLSQ